MLKNELEQVLDKDYHRNILQIFYSSYFLLFLKIIINIGELKLFLKKNNLLITFFTFEVVYQRHETKSCQRHTRDNGNNHGGGGGNKR